ncbi:TIGR04222 domain-containing membrane protein [Nocardia sp. NPDC005998]|uniref:TIGR04222 domain-containing membrane protein n=1 Tax=Nocardia sp. NPDC005998 TaxID=3156894 RepID=UPI0033AFEF11
MTGFVLIVLSALPVGVSALLRIPLWVRSIPELSASELGYLHRGGRGAVVTAVKSLDMDDVIAMNARRNFQRTRKTLPSDADELERAVFTDVRGPARLSELPERRYIRRELAATRDRLAQAGLIPRLWWRRTIVVVTLILIVVAVAAYWESDAVTWGNLAALVAGILAALCLLLFSRRTIAGGRLLRRERRESRRALADWEPAEPSPAGPAPDETDSDETDSDETDSDETDSDETDSDETDSDETDSDETDSAQGKGFFRNQHSLFKRLVALGMTVDLTAVTGIPVPSYGDHDGSDSDGWHWGGLAIWGSSDSGHGHDGAGHGHYDSGHGHYGAGHGHFDSGHGHYDGGHGGGDIGSAGGGY